MMKMKKNEKFRSLVQKLLSIEQNKKVGAECSSKRSATESDEAK